LLILETSTEHELAVWGAQAAGLQFAADCPEAAPYLRAIIRHRSPLDEMKRAEAVLLKSSDL
jgi:hypothetical protein